MLVMAKIDVCHLRQDMENSDVHQDSRVPREQHYSHVIWHVICHVTQHVTGTLWSGRFWLTSSVRYH
jgi:hypothetical protein